MVRLYLEGKKEAKDQTNGVAVIAPSVSTSMKVREIRISRGWTELLPKQADDVLVVVRSTLLNPLDYSYDSYSELKRDAEHQLDISGPNYHIYIYRLNDDLSVTQISHSLFSA